MPAEGVRAKHSPASPEVPFDRLRRCITRLIRFDMVSRECSESDESELLDELLSELDESSQLATGPGVASSSMMCCGVDSYRYECDISWKSKYTKYTSSRIYNQSAFRLLFFSFFFSTATDEMGLPTTLVPRLILRDCVSASLRSLNDAWNAVCKHVSQSLNSTRAELITGRTRLMTLRLKRQALIWVTVLL